MNLVFDQPKFLAKVDENVRKYGYCSVVVSEGVKGAYGKFLSDQGLRDAFGHAQLGGVAPVIAALIKQQLKLKYHWAVADYLQRAARHVASKTVAASPIRAQAIETCCAACRRAKTIGGDQNIGLDPMMIGLDHDFVRKDLMATHARAHSEIHA